MLTRVDARIAEIVKKKAGEKLDAVVLHAEELVRTEEKTPARALADALEKMKLV